MIAIDLERLNFSGAIADPLAAVVFCQPVNVDYTIVNGRVLVERGRLKRLDLSALLQTHRRCAAALLA